MSASLTWLVGDTWGMSHWECLILYVIPSPMYYKLYMFSHLDHRKILSVYERDLAVQKGPPNKQIRVDGLYR